MKGSRLIMLWTNGTKAPLSRSNPPVDGPQLAPLPGGGRAASISPARYPIIPMTVRLTATGSRIALLDPVSEKAVWPLPDPFPPPLIFTWRAALQPNQSARAETRIGAASATPEYSGKCSLILGCPRRNRNWQEAAGGTAHGDMQAAPNHPPRSFEAFAPVEMPRGKVR